MKPVVPDPFNITVMGLPFHGRVDNHTLTLPDESVMEYPRPTSSNWLLAKIQDAPDRVGNEIDALNNYDWRDRLLLNRTMLESPQHFIHIDARDVPWIIKVEYATPDTTYSIKLTLVGRFGLLQPDDYHTEHNYVFYESPVKNLDLEYLLSVRNPDSVEQNSRGDKILCAIQGRFYLNKYYGNANKDIVVTAELVELHISGVVSPENGIGLTAIANIIQTGIEVSTEGFDSTQHVTFYRDYVKSETCSCNGTKVITRTVTYRKELSTEGTITQIQDHDYQYTDILQFIKTAYYSDDDEIQIIEFKTTGYLESWSEYTWIGGTVSVDTWATGDSPYPDECEKLSYTHEVSGGYTKKGNVRYIREYKKEILIDGDSRAVFLYTSHHLSPNNRHMVSTYDDYSHTDYEAPYKNVDCTNPEDLASSTEMTKDQFYSCSDTYCVDTSESHIVRKLQVDSTVLAHYDSNIDLSYVSVPSTSGIWIGQYSNRVFKFSVNGYHYIGYPYIKAQYVALTDNDKLPTVYTKRYASYNPYDGVIEDSDDPIGFV